MALRRMLGSMPSRALVAVLGGVAATLLVFALEPVIDRRAEERALRSQMKEDLAATILLQKGLTAQSETNPEVAPADFEAFARDLMVGHFM